MTGSYESAGESADLSAPNALSAGSAAPNLSSSLSTGLNPGVGAGAPAAPPIAPGASTPAAPRATTLGLGARGSAKPDGLKRDGSASPGSLTPGSPTNDPARRSADQVARIRDRQNKRAAASLSPSKPTDPDTAREDRLKQLAAKNRAAAFKPPAAAPNAAPPTATAPNAPDNKAAPNKATSNQPPTVQPNGETVDEAIRSLMRDPRYWRDRNPDLQDHVAQQWQRAYPNPLFAIGLERPHQDPAILAHDVEPWPKPLPTPNPSTPGSENTITLRPLPAYPEDAPPLQNRPRPINPYDDPAGSYVWNEEAGKWVWESPKIYEMSQATDTAARHATPPDPSGGKLDAVASGTHPDDPANTPRPSNDLTGDVALPDDPNDLGEGTQVAMAQAAVLPFIPGTTAALSGAAALGLVGTALALGQISQQESDRLTSGINDGDAGVMDTVGQLYQSIIGVDVPASPPASDDSQAGRFDGTPGFESDAPDGAAPPSRPTGDDVRPSPPEFPDQSDDLPQGTILDARRHGEVPDDRIFGKGDNADTLRDARDGLIKAHKDRTGRLDGSGPAGQRGPAESPGWQAIKKEAGPKNVSRIGNRTVIKIDGKGNGTRRYSFDNGGNNRHPSEIEVYDQQGQHLGTLDPVTLQPIKGPIKGRRIDTSQAPTAPDAPIQPNARPPTRYV